MSLRILLCLLSFSGLSHAAEIFTNQAAQSVLGQFSFTTSVNNNPNIATRLSAPRGVAIDATTGKLFVADRDNNRVLRYSSASAYASGAAAERVFGQPTLDDTGFNSAAADSMYHPSSVAVDTSGRLYVLDAGFNRILRFNNATADGVNGPNANGVLGQSDFSTAGATITASGLNSPSDITFAGNYLWVADSGNNRVIGYANPSALINGGAATKVFGQTLLTTNNAPSPPTAQSMNSPEGVTIGDENIMWVADTGNNRVLRFVDPVNLANGTAAGKVLGKTAFTSGTVPASVTAANFYSPQGLALDDSGTETSLWVVDRVRARVLRFDNVNDPALANGSDASVVLGQPNLLSEGGGTTARRISAPYGVLVDSFTIADSPRTIWIADAGNNRVLRFTPYTPAPPKPAPPVISGATKYKTKKSKVRISGSASGGAGIVLVQYKGKKGGFRPAAGTTRWSFRGKCKPGKNRFTIIAVDALNRNSPPLTVTVKRK